jgi:hypothetical protein
MTDLRQAAQQALEALETLMLERGSIYETAITALREALAREHAMHDLARLGQEIEQEPVAKLFGTLPVFDTPPAAQRKPLTDEQKQRLVTDWFAEDWAVKKALGLLDDYEAAHNIKEGT